MALLSPPTVGVSAAMLFSGLLIGAAVLPFDVRRQGVQRLVEWLERERLTSTYSLPSMLRNALSLLPAGHRLNDLRFVKMGGEPVYRTDLQLYREHLRPDCLVQITLGTTETYAITWWHLKLSTQAVADQPVLPVGYAEDDSQVLLFDEADQQVARGEVGEIVIRSRFLSPGYWRQPEATRAVYTTLEDGVRQYRTGDLGRLLPDDNLQHLGRKDFVVKIRGHLVSPTEVEAALREIETVTDAAVVGRPDAVGQMRLVAFVVTTEGDDVDVPALRTRLGSHLPEYMLPTTFVRVERLPRLPNGKLDARALPSAEAQVAVRPRPYVDPRTPLEVLLAQVWSDVLGISRVGAGDIFAELGGDSLQAAQVLARMGAVCGVDLPFDVLLEGPTMAKLAQAIAVRLAADVERGELAGLLDQIEAMTDSEAAAHLTREFQPER